MCSTTDIYNFSMKFLKFKFQVWYLEVPYIYSFLVPGRNRMLMLVVVVVVV